MIREWCGVVTAQLAYERDRKDLRRQACPDAGQSRVHRDAEGARAAPGASGRGRSAHQEPISGFDPMNKPTNSNMRGTGSAGDASRS